jgi:26S proteasome regulatory subunit N2
VAGEAAAFGIGLLLAGHGTRTQHSRSAVFELLSYAHETSHEKIIRSIVISVALIMFGQENLAEPVIEQLCRDRDAIIRYGGTFAISLAYAGTANNSAVKRLLHMAVSDVSNDVRRAAVMCLGIVLYRTPHKVPTLVALLAESFNPHVRYGACLAIGIACAATGNNDSLLLLQPMLNDPVDFVRQGCLLALSLIFMLQTEFSTPSVKSFRGRISSIVSEKYPSILTKLGAIMATGIIDAGGRNCSLSLSASDGFVRSRACVGIALWLQHWYWYPMLHFLSLALAPSMLVGLNREFQLPRSFSVFCAAPASRYAYPPKTEEKRETKRERVITAILSTTLKQQARERARGKDDGSSTQKHINTGQNPNRKSRQVEGKKNCAFRDDDGYFFLTNPTRIIDTQLPHCAFLLDGRYTPAATDTKPVGVIMLIDHSPTVVADTIDIDRISLMSAKEADVPSPFSWPN